MTTAVKPLPAHGTLHRRKVHRCDCAPCLATERAYDTRRHRLIAYGRWQPYTDAEPARQHVRRLMAAGIGIQTIVRHSGVPSGTMTKLLYGERRTGKRPSRRIRPETAERLLALQLDIDLAADAARIDGTGTRRRLQALVAAGWPQRRLAARAGLDYQLVNKVVHGGARVHASTARTVRNLYRQLAAQDPRDHGVGPQHLAQARKTARAGGWPDPAFWEDYETIDDPQFDPATAEQAAPRYLALAEDWEWLRAQGCDLRQAAERLGVSKSHLEHSIRRARQQREAS